MNISKYSFIYLILLAFMACNIHEKQVSEDILTKNIDSSVSPGADFFLFANGKWIKNNPIPASESSWGVGHLVQNDIYLRLKTINEKAALEKATLGSVSQKVGDFWVTAMDSILADKQGLLPLTPYLQSIQSIASIDQLVSMASLMHKQGSDVFFDAGVGQDEKNSEKNMYHIFQGGLGMPNRDYYFNTDAKTLAVRKAYLQYLFITFKQLGEDSINATLFSKNVFDLETKLAKASRKLGELRDPYKNYNKIDLIGLQKTSPVFLWSNYFKQIGLEKLDSVIVGQPEFLTALSTELNATPIAIWKNYLRFHLVKSNANFLDNKSFMNSFTYSQTLRGVSEPKPRWKRVLDAEESAMGEALGQLFVKEYFNEQAKARYSKLVEDIREAYKERIAKLSWMSDSTKQKAYLKLSKITKKVGYPDKWRDFSSLKIDRSSYATNMIRAREWWYNDNIAKYGKPVDRTLWDMSPQTYNAYYNPSNNEIVLPAGIFAVPGMKDADLDDAFVYGYAGASTIGHEMTHGFDDQGRQFDAAGNLKNWWQDSDGKQFKERAAKIINQFNEFIPVDSLHVNGDATQGENIADLGGLLLGLDALKKTETFKKGGKINGYTPLQRYFLGYTYGWLDVSRKELLANQVRVDVHAPSKERVNGPFVNIPEFYEAFGIKPTDKMFRADSLRVKIW